MLLALLSLYFGGEVIRGFTFTMIWGVIVGTYSSIYIAAPFLIFTGVSTGGQTDRAKAAATPEAARPDGSRLLGGCHDGAVGEELLSRPGADRLWQWRLPLCRHVASRLAVDPSSGMHAWPPGSMAEIVVDSFAPAFAEQETIGLMLFGTGGRSFSAAIGRIALRAITLEAMDTGAAARTYNVLLAEGRAVAAALIAI